MRAARVRRALGVSVLLALCACVGPSYQLADLASDPIALVYRTREESEHRAERLARAKEKPRPRLPGEKHFRLEDVGDFLGLGRSLEERRADLLGRMALLDARTGEVETLSFAPRGARPLAWSPDRRRLLYQAPAGRRRESVFEYDRDTGEVRPIASGIHHYVGASYGPDGRFALARFDPREGPAARLRVFVTRPGGASPRAVTAGPRDSWPIWSPDGSVLVYSSVDAQGNPEIRAIDPLAGGEPKLIARGLEPSFSPEGDFLVYTGKRKGRWAIWRVRPDGLGRYPIGSSRHNERDPSMSPDGRFVVYVAEKDEHQRLMVRPLDGSGDRPLLIDGDGLLPVW
jgi:Tol biopolymer transport system component